jgi:hypothetical protein
MRLVSEVTTLLRHSATCNSVPGDFMETTMGKLSRQMGKCGVLASVMPMFAWRSASAFHSFIVQQKKSAKAFHCVKAINAVVALLSPSFVHRNNGKTKENASFA